MLSVKRSMFQLHRTLTYICIRTCKWKFEFNEHKRVNLFWGIFQFYCNLFELSLSLSIQPLYFSYQTHFFCFHLHSVAILQYICMKYKLAEHWYPLATPETHARVQEYLNWQHANIRFHGTMLFRILVRIPLVSYCSLTNYTFDSD